MNVQSILERAGAPPVTTRPDAPVAEVAETLADDGTGAVVACEPDGAIAGIVSERDLVRGLREHGERLLAMRVDDLMTRSVVTCSPEHSVEDVLRLMTENGVRHVPVVGSDGALAGVVSILDLVRSRLAEVESDYGTLRTFMETRIE